MDKTGGIFVCIIVLCSLMLSGCTSVANTKTNVDVLQQKPEALMNGMSFALCYSEYRSGQHPDLGKGAVYPSEEEILEDLKILTRNSNFGLIRLYNSGESSERVLKIIRENKINLKVVLGAWLGAEFSNHKGCSWLSEPIPQDYLDMVTGWNKKEVANTIRLANALIKANKRFDFFIFPGQRHGFGSMDEYFFWLRGDYFCKHLIGDFVDNVDIIEMNREKELN